MDKKLDIKIATHALELAPFGVCISGVNNELIYGNKTLYRIFQIEQENHDNNAGIPTAIYNAISRKEPYIEISSSSEGDKQTIKCWQHELSPSTNIYFFLDVTDKTAIYTEKALLEDELSRLSTRDELTGLANKTALLQGLEPLISRSRRYNNPLSIVHFEIDLSEKADHDNTLVKLAHMLRDQMRWADIIGRLDDKNFLLILPETPEDAANILVDKLTAKIDELNNSDELHMRVFFGIANWNTGDDSRLLLKRAAQNANQNRQASAA